MRATEFINEDYLKTKFDNFMKSYKFDKISKLEIGMYNVHLLVNYIDDITQINVLEVQVTQNIIDNNLQLNTETAMFGYVDEGEYFLRIEKA